MIENELLQLIIASLPVVVFCKDYKDTSIGRYVLINKAAEEFFGHKESEMLGATDYDFFPKHQADFFVHTDHSVLARGEVVDIKLEEVKGAKGDKRYVRTLKYPIAARYLLGVAIDITDQVLSEEAAQNERNIALNQMKLAAVGELAASMIHELKNPLSVAMAYMGRIEEEPEDVDYVRSKTPKVNGALERINMLIDRFKRYTFGSGDSRQNKIQPVQIFEVVQSVVSMMNYRCEQNCIELLLEPPSDEQVEVMGRPLEIEQILTNLVSNSLDAIRLQDSEQKELKGRINIFWQVDGKSLLIHVKDNGPGVPIEKRQEIFKPFVTSKRRGEGLGLGLSLSRTLAESMDGELRCENVEQGAQFSLRLLLKAD